MKAFNDYLKSLSTQNLAWWKGQAATLEVALTEALTEFNRGKATMEQVVEVEVARDKALKRIHEIEMNTFKNGEIK